MEKRQNLNFVDHIVVSKTTLVCTATYNADAHPECFILDQSVTGTTTAMANSNMYRMRTIFST